MSKITTTLTREGSEEPITQELTYNHAFSDIFGLGLILSSKSRSDSEFATDASGLLHVKEHLGYVKNHCLWGLQGIGALMISANPSEMCREDLSNVGGLIQNLAKLADEANGHMESVSNDMVARANKINDPQQAAYQFNVHSDAVEIRRTRNFSYADAVALAAVKKADALKEA